MSNGETVIATIENMREYAGAKDRTVFAWSPVTGEEYSADAEDYWNAPPGWTMTDSEEGPMELVRREPSKPIPVEAE
jgi:hypothetical protein